VRLQEKVLQTKWQESTNEVLMSTWEQLDDTSFDEETKEEEEANLYLMADTTSEIWDSKLDEKVNINNLETLQLAYHELLSNSSIMSKAYQNFRKDIRNLSKDYKQLQGKLEEKIDNSSKISTQLCDDIKSLKLNTTKLHLENEEICKERSSLLEDLQRLKNQLEGLQNEYTTLNKLHDCLNEKRCNLLKECSPVHKNYENLVASEHNLWVECERYKKSLKFSNDKLEQYEVLRKQP